MKPVVGVLALQGAFREHIKSIEANGGIAFELRWPEQLDRADGLIIPGGESTTINKLLNRYQFKPSLDAFYGIGKPIFGTCAGMILLARQVVNEQFGLNYIDLAVQRNAYGRQIESFEQYIELDLDHNMGHDPFKAIFIRAPRIIEVGPEVKILAKINNNVIMAQEKNILVSAFHPELGTDNRVHNYFLDMIKNNKREIQHVRSF